MKIHILPSPTATYSGHAYLVLGDWNKLSDVNALVDVGTDGSIVPAIGSISTGIGKNPVDRVVLTHSHFDHAGGLPAVVDAYHPEVLAYASLELVTRRLVPGEVLQLGDEEFEVLHTPEHSSDSVCLFGLKTRVLFSGDAPLHARYPGMYNEHFMAFVEDLLKRNVSAIYSGHDDPVVEQAAAQLRETLSVVQNSFLIPPASE